MGLLVGCAATASYELASTPAMITVCEGTQAYQKTLDLAERHCRRHGRHAELAQQTGQRCSHGSGTIMGYATHFRCVR